MRDAKTDGAPKHKRARLTKGEKLTLEALPNFEEMRRCKETEKWPIRK